MAEWLGGCRVKIPIPYERDESEMKAVRCNYYRRCLDDRDGGRESRDMVPTKVVTN